MVDRRQPDHVIGAAAIAGARFTDLKAMITDGATQYAYVDNPSWKADTAGSMIIRIRVNSLLGANGAKGFVGFGNNDANDAFLAFRQVRTAVTSNQNRFQIIDRRTNGGAVNTQSGGTALTAGTMYLTVISGNGTTSKITTNNVAQTLNGTNTGTWLGHIAGTDLRMTFGCIWVANTPSMFIDGNFADIAYVNRELTTAELTKLYNGGNPIDISRMGLGADLKSRWIFGDRGYTGGETILDRIGTNHLTMVGSPTIGTP